MMEETVEDLVAAYAIEKVPANEWDWQGIAEWGYKDFGFQLDIESDSLAEMTPDRLRELMLEKVRGIFDEKKEAFGEEMMDHLIKIIMLQIIPGILSFPF